VPDCDTQDTQLSEILGAKVYRVSQKGNNGLI
jgi:hypothetical protein